jgi:hypothetical protein
MTYTFYIKLGSTILQSSKRFDTEEEAWDQQYESFIKEACDD